MSRKKLNDLQEWHDLKHHSREINKATLRYLFDRDRDRILKFSIREDDLILDYSKNLISEKTLNLLIKLATARNVQAEIEGLFNGHKINTTEDRAVLHTALRNRDGTPLIVDGINVMPGIMSVLDRMKTLSRAVRNGEWKGFGKKTVTHIVHIGIGGSGLGPRLAVGALEFYRKRNLKFYFVSNVDGTQISETLKRLNPEKTLFIIASKTFGTDETITNAQTAKQWITDHFKNEKAVSDHFLAITSQLRRAKDFGIDQQNILEIWDWVGGRFSISSAVGLPLMMAIGYRRFMEFLRGFRWMDLHFMNTPFRSNMPVILALLGIWYINFFSVPCQAVVPYDHYLRDFPLYLQQLEMESNGKSIDRDGQPVTYQTAVPVWGQPGTDCQHAFFQLFHQGTRMIPCDFIGFYQSLNEVNVHHKKLTAHFFAQAEALAFGKTRAELIREGVAEKLIPFRICPGNRPITSIMAMRLTPEILGKLIALYEHKVFVQGVIWNINSFDQWGVELGKQLSEVLFRDLSDNQTRSLEHGGSAGELIRFFRNRQNFVDKKD